MTEYFEHICEGGERWDMIAFRYYGNARRIAPILKANPDLVKLDPAPLVLRKGSVVIVPVLDDDTAAVPVPPWRQP